MRKIGALVVTLAVLVLITRLAGQSASRGNAAKRFIGSWRLVSIVENGQPDPNRGAHPTGLIYYDGSGQMAVQIMPERPRPKYASSEPTPDEARAAVIGYGAYFGTYTLDERVRTVTHHRQGSINPGDVGVPAVRRYEFAPGDRLILTPLENPTRHLTWERIK